jgi:hypothetical protein
MQHMRNPCYGRGFAVSETPYGTAMEPLADGAVPGCPPRRRFPTATPRWYRVQRTPTEHPRPRKWPVLARGPGSAGVFPCGLGGTLSQHGKNRLGPGLSLVPKAGVLWGCWERRDPDFSVGGSGQRDCGSRRKAGQMCADRRGLPDYAADPWEAR